MKLYPPGINAMPTGGRDVVHHGGVMRRLQELLG
jgi:hypothetical protein